MNKKLLRKKLALMLANLKKKRKYYTEIEYLENTGTGANRNWINTGIVPNTNTKWEVRVAFNNTSTGKLMGSGFATPTRFNLGIESNKFRFAFNAWFDANQSIITPDTNAHTWIMDATSKTFTIDEYSTTPTYTFGTSTYPICLFCRANSASGNTETNNNSLCKIYYTKIWDNGVLVRDMIPVLDWNYVPCMYDKVTEQLFYNQGTGSFVAGRQIHPVDYLESTGTQYIDTRVNGDSDKTYDMSFYVPSNKYNGVFGSWKTTDTTCRFTVANGSNAVLLYFRFNALEKTYRKSSDAFVFSAQCTKNSVTVNGSILSYEEQTFNTENSIFIFGINRCSTQLLSASGTKCYYCKIYDNGTLVRDFIPAIDENGVGFMFDRVSHTCFLNQGTGAFKYPAREVEYLESTGTQYILTGFTPTVNTDFELELSSTKTSTNWAMGCPTWVGVHYKGVDGQIGITNSSTSGFQQYINYARDNTRITMKLQGNTVYADGVSLGTITRRAGTLDFALFGYRDANRGAGLLFIGSIYKCIIWDNGVPVRDFYPAFKDGQVGMYDKVSGVLKTNTGTGSFTTGKIVEPEYE